MNCLSCGKEFKTTEKRNICDECYDFNSSLRLFHGEDILEMLKRNNIGAWYGIPGAGERIDEISHVKVSNFVIIETEDNKGTIEFKVAADVVFKDEK
jgi:hypothetical protein